ncbi:hypothetical protein K9M78_03990 [Candidatus Bipolaricaulota bacterium]|nr:hypothetical protein [Candidatus Bipolaricaulota bacterium]
MFNDIRFNLNDILPILPVLYLSLGLIFAPVRGGQAKEKVEFSGYTWQVKHFLHQTVGPGPNYWSSSGRNVRVDESGNLHLRIIENRCRWYSSEVWLDRALGYGTYEFTVDLPERTFARNVVLGLFNYLTDRKEFDIEVTKREENSPTNVQFVVQPSVRDKNIKRFPLDKKEGTKKVFSYTWTRNELIFRFEDCNDKSCSKRVLLEEWKYRGDLLPRGDLRTHINLWLVDGKPPSDGREVEVILEDFTFSPLGKEVS